MPHDIVANEDCTTLFVAEIGPNQVWKFNSSGPFPGAFKVPHGLTTESVAVFISVMSLVVLLLMVMFRANRNSIPCFLKSSNSDNIALDPERVGFTRVSTSEH